MRRFKGFLMHFVYASNIRFKSAMELDRRHADLHINASERRCVLSQLVSIVRVQRGLRYIDMEWILSSVICPVGSKFKSRKLRISSATVVPIVIECNLNSKYYLNSVHCTSSL